MKRDNLLISLVAACILMNNRAVALEAENLIGGWNGDIHSFPYFVFIKSRGSHVCGGSLIAPNSVVTAAHCVFDAKTRIFTDRPYRVFAGISNANSNAYSTTVTKIYSHREYQIYKGEYYNDIAVLRLAASFDSSGRLPISVVTLPPRYENYLSGSALLVAAGYDKVFPVQNSFTRETKYEGSSNGNLKFAYVDLVNNAVGCTASTFPGTICGKVQKTSWKVTDSVCYGDSGSPLMINNKIIGITSTTAENCNDRYLHTTFTKVSNYIDFINNAVNDVLTTDMLVKMSDYKTLYVPYYNGEATIKLSGEMSYDQLVASLQFEQAVNELIRLKTELESKIIATAVIPEVVIIQRLVNEIKNKISLLWNKAVVDWTPYQ